MIFDFEFTPVRRNKGRLIVASERDWQQFGLACHGELERFGNRTPKIRINAEVLFSGDEAEVNCSHGGELSINKGQGADGNWWCSCWTVVDDDWGASPAYLSDIQNRLFEIIEGSQAELFWWLGDSHFSEFTIPLCRRYPKLTCLKKAAANWFVGVSESKSKCLKSIEHFLKGTWTE